MTDRSLFDEALIRPRGERRTFLDQACAGQPQLRAVVESLLAEHDAACDLAQKSATEGHPTVESPGTPSPEVCLGSAATSEFTPQAGEIPETSPVPARVGQPAGAGLLIAGRYSLERKIGEGGMGEVWVAIQTEPVKRKVAIKLVKPGLDSKRVIARFEQERQALAPMDHPSIARVLDADFWLCPLTSGSDQATEYASKADAISERTQAPEVRP